MDPLTHTLTGLTVSRAGLNRWSAHATPLLLLAANAPDCDVVSWAWGTTAYLNYHRHITHSLVAIPFLAVLPVLIVRMFARKQFNWKRAYVVSLIGVATHPFLDWLNVYGVRWFLPFSGEWVRLDTTYIVDLWIWAVLLLAAAAPALSGLVSSEIGARSGGGRGIAIFALFFLVAYSGGRYILHQRAVAILDSRIYDGRAAVRVAAFPRPANPFAWTGLVETATWYSFYDLNLLGDFDPAAGRKFYKTEPNPAEVAAAEAAKRTETFRAFLNFSQFPFWRFTAVDEPEAATRVEVMDLRFGDPANPRFVASAIVTEDGRVERAAFSF
ncbi:MAG TPA: metal-dependent hydrolase [Bryobacteraceae bacterium]|nr:metal-dependent hydrolase [Bryobacteraceae bacterium]HOQ44237.1 metal-dependent hydrolase [Bryobacteraceae bacterium]HPQ15010.1 metal-dependent hydrolase [Bryobacteraceae bacterium]HPU70555.1 metal-dependent hydrolase [Bryobacteraceae bacterium]